MTTRHRTLSECGESLSAINDLPSHTATWQEDDEGDDLNENERRALHDALSASWRSVETGRLKPMFIDCGRTAETPVILPVRITPEAETQITCITSRGQKTYPASPSGMRNVARVHH